MTENHIDNPFLEGIKLVIKTQFPSQKDFAKGVTSDVNLSNVLRGKGGTSEAMRRRLAERANMSIEDVVALGKKSLEKKEETHTMSTSPNHFAEKLPEMSASDIISSVNTACNNINTQLLNHTQVLTNVVTALTAERDKLINSLHQEQSILNAVTDRIKLVNTKYEIVYCNRAYTEKHVMFPGDSIKDEKDKASLSLELIVKTLTLGTPSIDLVKNSEGKMESVMAYPQFYRDGSINGVLVVNRSIHQFETLLNNMGYVKREDVK